MGNIELLSSALCFIEEHLNEKISTDKIAEACYCSRSTLEKLFRYVNNITVREYVLRRRMTKAAREIAGESGEDILTIALRYGYSSHESFTRAFKQVWNCKPSDYRKKRYFELYPRILIPLETGDEYMKTRKNVDITELYDLFKERRNCYFVCCDICSLVPINEISTKAGDLAIIESMNRMNDAAGDGDMVFRIGGDEFALLTDSTEESYANEVREKIMARNGEEIEFDGRKIPLALHIGIVKADDCQVRYSELFSKLHDGLLASKKR